MYLCINVIAYSSSTGHDKKINIYTCFVFYREQINKKNNIIITDMDQDIIFNDIWEKNYDYIETLIIGAVTIQNKHSNFKDSTVTTIKQN